MIGYLHVRLPQRQMRSALRDLEQEQGFDVPLSLVRRVAASRLALEEALPGAKIDLVSDEADKLQLEVYGFADAAAAERIARDVLSTVDENLQFLAFKQEDAVATAPAAVEDAPAVSMPAQELDSSAEADLAVEDTDGEEIVLENAGLAEEPAGQEVAVDEDELLADVVEDDEFIETGEVVETEEVVDTALAVIPASTAIDTASSLQSSRPSEMSMLAGSLANDSPLMAIAEALLRGRSSEHTRRTYAKDLRHFLRWCSEHGISPQHANRDHLIAYKDFVMGKYAGASPKRMMSVVRTLYSELEVRDMLPGRNPALRLPKVETKPSELPPALTLSQAKEMLRLIAAERHLDDLDSRELLTLRDIAIIKLLLTTGARRGAIVGSKVGDLQIKRGYPIIFIRTKGNKAFDAKMPVDTYQAIQDYLEAMENHGLPLQEEDPLFVELGVHVPSKIGQLEATGLWAMVRRRLRMIGVDAPGTGVHYFRASHITLAHEGGADLYTIAESVGHSDTRMTQHYIRRADRLKHGSSDHVNL